MTSFGEEFLGCLHRDKSTTYKMASLPGPSVQGGMPETATRVDQASLMEQGRLGLQITSPALGSAAHDTLGISLDPVSPQVLSRIAHQLENFQPSVARSVVAALQPQITSLEARVSALKRDSLAHHAGTSPPAPDIVSADVVAAVSASLSGQFEGLANQTAAAVAAAATAAAALQPDQSDNSLHDVAAAFAEEIHGHLQWSIEEAFRPQLQKFEQLMSASRQHPKQESSPTFAEDVEEIHRPPEQILQRTRRGCLHASTMSTLGQVKRQTTLSRNTLPSRAFVVNFRRLVEVQKILGIIHEFIRSTAIATLTLVACANWSQLTFSIVFVSLVLTLFAIHEMRHDRMDIDDYKSLVELLEDDDGRCHGQTIENPNRLLKALHLSKNGSRRSRAFITIFCAICILLLVWINIFWAWASLSEGEKWWGVFNENDRMVQATLLLVGTAMVAFHITFEWLYWRETQCVMPYVEGSTGRRALDPRATGDGVPRQYRWFGLPSMWFTSREGYDDLRLWITLSRHDNHQIVTKIHPEELALFAIAPQGAAYLRRTLADAKLFNVGTWEFLTRDDGFPPRPVKKGESPDQLEMTFVFFDKASGQFLQPEQDYNSGLMKLLTRTGTF